MLIEPWSACASIGQSCRRTPRIYNKQPKQRRRKNKAAYGHGRPTATSLLYPRSSPTPLLLHQPSTAAPISRSEFLDKILRDIEAAIDRGGLVEISTFCTFLESCYQSGHFAHGLRLHHLIPSSLLRRNAELSSKLLRLYASCGQMDIAHQLFDEMPMSLRTRMAFPWNVLISGYVEKGLFEDAIALYHQMEDERVEPDPFTFPRVLKACAGLGSIILGEAVHRHALRTGHAGHPVVLNALVDMYAKCGDIQRARTAFQRMTRRDIVSWNSMVFGYSRHGLHSEAASLCREMALSGFKPDSVSISTLLAGASSVNPRIGFEIHGWVIRHGLESHLSVANALITMYAEARRVKHAREVFESIRDKDVVSWNAIIAAYRRDCEALFLFERMVVHGVNPDRITFMLVLTVCAKLGLVGRGRELFALMEGFGIRVGMEHCSCMVNLLGRVGLVEEAYRFISERMDSDAGPTVWGALLYACSLHGNVEIGEIAGERLFELEPDNGHNFELMMQVYAKVGRQADVDRIRQMMQARGLD